MLKIIYPYIRFSSAIQSEGHSHQRQLERIRAYADANNFIINDTLNLRDLGVSAFYAKNLEEGASLKLFIDAVDDGIVPTDGSSYLCIEQFDRLSRQNIDSSYSLFRKILRKNVNIITLMDNKIYTKDSLEDIVSIMSSLLLMQQANIESQKKSDRISAIFKSKIKDLKNGEKILFATMLPGWINNNGNNKTTNFSFNEKAETVKKIFNLYISGYSMGNIAKYLNDNSIPQIARKRTKNYNFNWNSGKISHLLSNQAVIGHLKIKKTNDIFCDYYPAIIEKEQWDIVQGMKKKRNERKSAGRTSINIFKGKLFCSECGNRYYFETDEKKYKGNVYKYQLLKCSGRRFNSCNSTTIRYNEFINNIPKFCIGIGKPNIINNEYLEKLKKQLDENKNSLLLLKEEQLELKNLLENNKVSHTIYAQTSTILEDKILKKEANIQAILFNISFQSNDNRVDTFDANDPTSILKVKKFINDNYAAIILSSTYNTGLIMGISGSLFTFRIDNKKLDYPIKAILAKDKIKEDLLQKRIENKLDSKLNEVLDALIFNDVDISI